MTSSDDLPQEADDNSNDKEQENGNRDHQTTDAEESAPLIPITKADPDRAVLSILENPSVLDALVQEAPAEVIKFVDASDIDSSGISCRKKKIGIRNNWLVKQRKE